MKYGALFEELIDFKEGTISVRLSIKLKLYDFNKSDW